MIQELEINWFTHRTGDPFADVGGYVIEYLLENGDTKGKDIFQLIEWMTKIYVNKWGGKLNAFFLNSTITQPAFNLESKTIETLNYFRKLINDESPSKKGCCRILGVNTNLFSAGRSNHIMSGSGTLINFHHGFENGIFLSKEVLIRMFFVPLGVEQLGDKIAIIASNNDATNRFIITKNVTNNLKDLASGISKSIQRSIFTKPANAIFDYANQCIDNVKTATYDEDSDKSMSKGITLNLFHFTNFGATPTINLYTLPATVFLFYSHCVLRHKKDWSAFTTANYKKYIGYNAANYDEVTETYSEKVSEYVLIPKGKVQKLQAFEDLNFTLSIAGEETLHEKLETEKNKTIEVECVVFSKSEFDNWKTSKLYNDWRADNKDFKIGNSVIKKSKTLIYKQEDFSRKWINIIYENLLNDKPILSKILEWNKRFPFDFRITKIYQINLRKMNKETVRQIEVISDYIIKDVGNIKKNITKIKTSKYAELRSFLIKQIENNYKKGNTMLISLNDYVKYLFPEDRNWSEVRDLMLICIYQKLHENPNISISEINGDEEEEDVEIPIVE